MMKYIWGTIPLCIVIVMTGCSTTPNRYIEPEATNTQVKLASLQGFASRSEKSFLTGSRIYTSVLKIDGYNVVQHSAKARPIYLTPGKHIVAFVNNRTGNDECDYISQSAIKMNFRRGTAYHVVSTFNGKQFRTWVANNKGQRVSGIIVSTGTHVR